MTNLSVTEILFSRREQQNQPNARTDGRYIALIIEGGAMRGVVSGGMVAALEQLGLKNSFDEIYGSSAGAIAGAYFVADQARYGTTIFYENINNKNFIDLSRAFSRKSIVSLEFLLDQVCVNEKPLAFEKIISSPIILNVVAASASLHRSVSLNDFEDFSEIRDALRASARIPFFAGSPVEFRGDRYLDASIYESVPFRTALQNPKITDIVVLLTRPVGDLRSEPNIIDRYLVAPYLKKIDPELAGHYLARASEYKNEIHELMDMASIDTPGRIGTLLIQLPKNANKVSPFERKREVLARGAMDGFTSVYKSLGLASPNLVEIITPFAV